jgi:DHA1 family multidrug resistance protein-like MFS transporter
VQSERAAERPAAASRERLVWLAGFLIGSMAWSICWPFLPLRVQAVGAGDLADVARLSGLLAGGTNLVTAALGPFWTTLGERFGYRLQILRAHLGTALSMSLIGLARTPLELVGAGGILGVLGGNYPHYMALVASRTPAAEVGRVVGDMQAAGQIGGTIGPLIGGLVASQFGLTAAFLVAGVTSMVGLGLIARLVPADAGTRRDPARPRGSLRDAFSRPEQRRLMLLMLAGDAAIQGLRPLVPILLATRIADPSTLAATTGLATTLAAVGTVVSALVVGRLSRRVAPRYLLLASMPFAAVAAALVPLAGSLPVLLLLLTLLGLTSGATVPAIFAWLGQVSPSSSGGFALMATTSMLGFALGPMVMGQATIYGLDAPFRLAAGITVVGLVLVATSNPARMSAQAAR